MGPVDSSRRRASPFSLVRCSTGDNRVRPVDIESTNRLVNGIDSCNLCCAHMLARFYFRVGFSLLTTPSVFLSYAVPLTELFATPQVAGC